MQALKTTLVRPIRCPDCRARMAPDATRCACGYVDEHAPDMADARENLVNKAERLYESYLSARIMRARKAVIDIRARRMRTPGDESLLRQLRTAEKELRAVEMQLVAQNAKIAEEESANNEITEQVETPASSIDEQPTTAEPPARFRAMQATRADEVPRVQPVEKFTAAQAKQAEQALAASDPSLKICPECEATLSPAAPQCICGYNFRLAKRQPAFLTSEEIRALRGQ